MSYRPVFIIGILLTSWWFALPSAQAQTLKNSSLPTQLNDARGLETQLQVLGNAQRIEGSRIGVAAALNPAYLPISQAFKEVINRDDAIDIGHIKASIERASPAGRLYLAALVQRLNKAEGDRILTDLRSDQSLVTERSGCTGASFTVSNVATELLKNGSISIYLP